MLVHEIPYGDPLAALQVFADDPVCAFLDSAATGDPRAAWSYIAADPFSVITADAAGVTVDGLAVEGDPFRVLQHEMQRHTLGAGECPVPFQTGAVGYLAYELGNHLERLPAPRSAAAPVPDLFMGLYDTVAAYDHARRKAYIVSSGRPERGAAAERRAQTRLGAFRDRLARAPRTAPAPDWRATTRFTPERPRAAVEKAIADVIAYLRAGDIFQSNLTQQMRAPAVEGLGDLELYLRLRALSPAPFAAFLRCGPDVSVLSASPERYLSLATDGWVETRPIKGTRPRGADAARDAAQAADLLASPKDRAENLMIVDLMRNDLARVSRIGSVRVPRLCGLETFASVHHLVSVVESRLKDGLGAVDLLRACFPGGSITGAPKIRAMEVIHELEPAPRGVYCGSVAWLGFDGAMDSSIVIRTIVRSGDTLMAQAGGGIVADSDPAAEYEESLVKLAPLLRATAGERP